MKKKLFLILVFCVASALSAQDTKVKNTSPFYSNWLPYVGYINDYQNSQSLFTSVNIGIGFLYGSGIEGNLAGTPQDHYQFFGNIPYRGKISYNKTPLYEYLVGYRLFSWLKVGLSMQSQQNVVLTTPQLPGFGGAFNVNGQTHGVLSSYVNLYSISLKTYLEVPFPIVWYYASSSLYFGLGIGPSWQSFYNNNVTYTYNDGSYATSKLPLKQKISANASYSFDFGFRIRNIKPSKNYSMLLGCRYNSWGQVRSIGKVTQQNDYRAGLFKPFKIKRLYSFAPYMGFQWNFDSYPEQVENYKKPQPKFSQKQFTSLSLGIGFLYFDNFSGQINVVPNAAFASSGIATVKEPLSYNRTPLFEFLVGFEPLAWFKYAVSIQNQQSIGLSTPLITSFNATNDFDYYQLNMQLELSSIMLKAYFQLPGNYNVAKLFSFTPSIAFGVGPSWQTYSNIQLYRIFAEVNSEVENNILPLRQITSSNAAWMIDTSIAFKSYSNPKLFNLSLGCKYNQWGQCKNIGEIQDQNTLNYGLAHPFRIKTVYSFSPYISFEWDFDLCYQYTLASKYIDTYIPFFTKAQNLQSKKCVYTKFNTGLGFLYFDQVKGDFAGNPASEFTPIGSVPYKYKLIYNRSIVYDFEIGYRCNHWLKVALNYQSQPGVFLSTNDLPSYNGTSNEILAKFQANLDLNAIVTKFIFSPPYSLVFKGWATTPHLGLGVGPSWQSYSDIEVINFGIINNVGSGSQINLKQKTTANAFFLVDLGLSFKNAIKNAPIEILLGVKYNQWGQCQQIGGLSEQNDLKIALFKPFSIRMIYSFVPYLGIGWNY